MLDFDPRDYDSRDAERHGPNHARSPRGSDNSYDRNDDWTQPNAGDRDRDNDARTLGRGPGSDSPASHPDEHARDRGHDGRWPEREREGRERVADPRDTFVRHVHLPRGLDRQIVRDRDREYTLRWSESRTLATVGAFRVVSSRDLRDYHDRPLDPRSGDLRHLREQGLVETVRVPGYREHAVALTKEGRSVLECRDPPRERQQTFYAGVTRERELEHDVQVYRAYEREAASDRLALARPASRRRVPPPGGRRRHPHHPVDAGARERAADAALLNVTDEELRKGLEVSWNDGR
jgi:hypothetical protein